MSSEGESPDTSNIGLVLAHLEREFMFAQTLFLGENLLPLLALAFGGALGVGNLLALVKPPENRKDDSDLERPPLARTLIFIALGAVMTIWALVSLFSS
ncbi:MAG: putative membrane protein SpoIIM required for sporulation [Verrucomicrobiales bacterium]|jgi:uncharacterized membrane protein SpoIIM required for sporulation